MDSPPIIVICADLSSCCVWDQYGVGESLPASFPDIIGLVELEERLARWAWPYDQAYAASNGVKENMLMDWDRFNGEGIQLAQEAKSLLGSRAVLFYEKAPFDATCEFDPSLLIE